MRIVEIDPTSPLFGHIRPGYSLVSINGRAVLDSIDFQYKMSEDRVKMLFEDNSGQELEFDFEGELAGDLGLVLDDSKVKMCKCDCIFCFVRQQPTGMRRALYIKDEDYRLSFTHGNFITLSNMTDADLERIIEQRLSPMYVSVHATDDKLRRCMLRNEKLHPIIPRIKYMGENGITVHTQAVLCPGINDGPYLEKTVAELAALYPDVETLAVVPVGLTKYRDDLSDLRAYTPEEAKAVIDYIEKVQRRLLKKIGTRFVWAADEFYIQAEQDFPAHSAYEDMSQFENGIGMARESITMFNRRRAHLKKLSSDKRVLFLTGQSACPFMKKYFQTYVNDMLCLNLTVEAVENRFWGNSVTVSGLLTGQDMLRFARAREKEYDTVVIPPNSLNQDDLFLDNLSLDQFKNVLSCDVLLGQYDIATTIKEAFV